MYKMVARALADELVVHPVTTATASSIAAEKTILSSSHATTTSSDKEEWQTITLKCIPFTRPTNNNSSANEMMIARSKTSIGAESDVVITHQPSNPLYINVALMDDNDREKRCFHCILTDCPGLNGKLGGVTPELFAKLFAPSSGTKKKVVVA